MPAASAASSYLVATVADEPAACNRGDRTDGTDGSGARHDETLAYYCELSHLPDLPALRLGVSTRPPEPGYRVEDWTW